MAPLPMVPLALTLGETILASAFTAFFTAAFVTAGAGFLVKRVEIKEAQRREIADRQHAKQIREAEEERSRVLLKQSADHDERQLGREHDFQARSALRESYARLLVVQRRSRETCLIVANLIKSDATENTLQEAKSAAKQAHDAFIDEYHRLVLDADPNMWLELRGLRHILDDMLKYAQSGNAQQIEVLKEYARDARQNLERTLRQRLGYEALQKRDLLPYPYDKVEKEKSKDLRLELR